jgi:hypothetical protein
MEDMVIGAITSILSVSGGAAWIAALISPKYLPVISGIINVIAGNVKFASNK